MKVSSKGGLRETLIYGEGRKEKGITLLEGSLTSPARPSRGSSMEMKKYKDDFRTVTAAASNKGRGILTSH